MADNQSIYPYPGPNITNAPRLLVPITLTLAIAWGLYAARIYTRLRPVNNLGWDDYTVSGAIVSLGHVPILKRLHRSNTQREYFHLFSCHCHRNSKAV